VLDGGMFSSVVFIVSGEQTLYGTRMGMRSCVRGASMSMDVWMGIHASSSTLPAPATSGLILWKSFSLTVWMHTDGQAVYGGTGVQRTTGLSTR
jgi:hypothetical protein